MIIKFFPRAHVFIRVYTPTPDQVSSNGLRVLLRSVVKGGGGSGLCQLIQRGIEKRQTVDEDILPPGYTNQLFRIRGYDMDSALVLGLVTYNKNTHTDTYVIEII